MAYTLLVNTGNNSATWAVRSKAALLLALMTKRMGHLFWERVLPELISYANQGPVQAEKVTPSKCAISQTVRVNVMQTRQELG